MNMSKQLSVLIVDDEAELRKSVASILHSNFPDWTLRIDEASKYLPMDQLAISPQCGFSSGAYDRCCTWDEQRRKLELVVDVAATAWPAG